MESLCFSLLIPNLATKHVDLRFVTDNQQDLEVAQDDYECNDETVESEVDEIEIDTTKPAASTATTVSKAKPKPAVKRKKATKAAAPKPKKKKEVCTFTFETEHPSKFVLQSTVIDSFIYLIGSMLKCFLTIMVKMHSTMDDFLPIC